MKKYRKIIIKVVVSAILLGIIFLKVDKQEIVAHIKLLDIKYVPLIILLLCSNYFFSSVRWKQLLIYKDTEHVTVSYLTSLYFIGSFFNNFMPTSIGGDVFKIYRLGKKINNIPNAFSATFMERFSGVVVLGLISLVGLIKYIGWYTLGLFVLFILGFFAGIYFLKVAGKRVKKIQDIYNSLYEYKDAHRVLVIAFFTSILVQLISIFTQYFVFKSIGVTLPLFYSLLVFPVIILASFFIPSLNGVGVQDTLYIQLFGVVGVSSAVALSASILFHLFRLGVSLIGGLLYALGKDE